MEPLNTNLKYFTLNTRSLQIPNAGATWLKVLFSFFLISSNFNMSSQDSCDSLSWSLGKNEFAIDGDKLNRDMESKGWNSSFFENNDVEIQIFGYSDCSENHETNKLVSKNRTEYLRNYMRKLRVSNVPAVSTEAVPEKNCNTQMTLKGSRLLICWKPKNEAPEAPKPVVIEEKPAPEGEMTLDRINELNVGETLVLDGLNFYPGRHQILNDAKPVLKKLLEILRDNPSLQIEVQGHICCSNRPNDDGIDEETGEKRLSWMRAQFVNDYLVKNGIDQKRISYKGFAMQRPLRTPEITIQDQIKNRRVEVMVTAK